MTENIGPVCLDEMIGSSIELRFDIPEYRAPSGVRLTYQHSNGSKCVADPATAEGVENILADLRRTPLQASRSRAA